MIWYTCIRDTLLFSADGLCLFVGELSGKRDKLWFLHTTGEARLLALVGVTPRSTE